jgi:hypothetical protein
LIKGVEKIWQIGKIESGGYGDEKRDPPQNF